MPSPLRIEHVLTAESRAEYQKLVEQKPELPPDLEGLFKVLGSRAKDQQVQQDQILRTLVTQHQDSGSEYQALQLWLLWIFRNPIAGIAARASNRPGDMDELLQTVSWCFLETVNRIDPQTPYILKNLHRETNKLVRQELGFNSIREPEIVQELEVLLESGWEPEACERESILKDLQLSQNELDLLIGKYIYNESHEELASQLGIKPTALRQRMHRILKTLRAKKSF